jgi:hypothetical protein
MSRLIAAALAALLLFATVPAFADEVAADEAATDQDAIVAEDQVLTCENPDELEVVTLGGLESEINSPDLSLIDTETKSFLVDLGEDVPEAAVDLTVDMTWGTLLNDYDLEVTADETRTSDNAQPFDPNEESVTLPVTHCQVIEVVAYNFFALQPTAALSLALTIAESDDEAELDEETSAALLLEALEDFRGL